MSGEALSGVPAAWPVLQLLIYPYPNEPRLVLIAANRLVRARSALHGAVTEREGCAVDVEGVRRKL